MKGLLASVLAAAALTAPTRPEKAPPKPASHTLRNIEGWTIHVDDRLLGPDKDLGDRALRLLAHRLFAVKMAVPADRVAQLQQVHIHLDRTHGKLKPAQYHPSAGWLKSNGYDEALVHCVHIPDVVDFLDPEMQRAQPWMVLHELAHAYHDQFLENGFDNAEVKACYQAAKEAGIYEKVLLYDGRRVRHYALTNQMEYFAEMTESFFGVNDFYPFVRAELKQHDPRMHDLLAKVWGVRK
jgi:hypothetical protein